MRVHTEIVKCDICQEIIETPLSPHINMQWVISEMVFSVYSSRERTVRDICEKCNTKIMNTIFDLMTRKIK